MKLQLNFMKPDNYAFFCPVSRVHLTRSNPVATCDEVTSYIARGLKSNVILDITDAESGQKPENKTKVKKSEVVSASPEDSEIKEEKTEVISETVEEKQEVSEVKSETVETTEKEEKPEKAEKPKRRKTSK